MTKHFTRVSTMSFYKMLFLLAITMTTVTTEASDYCNVQCSGSSDKHTMCQYTEGGGCPHNSRGVTDEDRQIILDVHNELRQKVALGKETRGSQPPASNMRELQWDSELETIAQRWADQCLNTPHDSCRNTLDGTVCGQNVYFSSHEDKKKSMKTSITNFYEEVAQFDRNLVPSFKQQQAFSMNVAHYSQVVWAETSKVGCGYVDNPDTQSGYPVKVVCNYKKAGNYENQPVYLTGEACSACPSDAPKCSSKWNGLCSAEGSNGSAVKPTGGSKDSAVKPSGGSKDSAVKPSGGSKDSAVKPTRGSPVSAGKKTRLKLTIKNM